MLKKCQSLAEKADYAALKANILPRVQHLSLATTSAAVRQAAFKALTSLAPRFDKEVATNLVSTLQQVGRQHSKSRACVRDIYCTPLEQMQIFCKT